MLNHKVLANIHKLSRILLY